MTGFNTQFSAECISLLNLVMALKLLLRKRVGVLPRHPGQTSPLASDAVSLWPDEPDISPMDV